ncbi:MAG: hypothetical protein H6733_09120 [Alphaproteobacteria bacterium]|nr:hypothetical protein [Alphaproteobacteria bacterium]
MSVNASSVDFEMRSTSGRSISVFGCLRTPGGGVVLRTTYSTHVFGESSADPERHDLELPRATVPLARMRELVERFETFGRGLASDEKPVDCTVDLSVMPKLVLGLADDDPELIVASWQAVFHLTLLAGPALKFQAKYVVDSTCLDLFLEGIGEVCR